VRVLLDTHALLWALGEPDRLSKKARKLIVDEANELVVSACCAWEIATKHRIGKLPGAEVLLDSWNDTLRRLRATPEPIEHTHALRAGRYPTAHRDPFDRLLAAHAELAALPLVTIDPAFAAFPITRIW
jgi:PIN domain nuclease of toxin-antitoxin system